MDYEAYNCAIHPDPKKQDKIWVNIGGSDATLATLTMGVGEMSEDGFYDDYVAFDMETQSGIDETISMLNEAKGLLASYLEYWGENG